MDESSMNGAYYLNHNEAITEIQKLFQMEII